MDEMHRFRLLKTGFNRAFFNMGLDEAILEGVASGASLPVLRFYGWEPAAVSIGYFQGLEEEVDTAACAARGIDVVRRITGGGAVLHQHEITYSIIMGESHPLACGTITESYERLCTGIIAGLDLLGIPSQFAPINDILAGGRKISGNAQTRKNGCLLQHGTILLDTDIDLMFSLLKVPSEKVKDKIIRDVKDRVTGINALLGYELPFDQGVHAFAEGFRTALSLDFGNGHLNDPEGAGAEEEERARSLGREKFAAPDWLRLR